MATKKPKMEDLKIPNEVQTNPSLTTKGRGKVERIREHSKGFSQSIVVINFMNEFINHPNAERLLPDPENKCLNCDFARWSTKIDKKNDEDTERYAGSKANPENYQVKKLVCFCKDMFERVFSSENAPKDEVIDCDGPEIARELAEEKKNGK